MTEVFVPFASTVVGDALIVDVVSSFGRKTNETCAVSTSWVLVVASVAVNVTGSGSGSVTVKVATPSALLTPPATGVTTALTEEAAKSTVSPEMGVPVESFNVTVTVDDWLDNGWPMTEV
jgi:anthranilate phosphoribosyltransferase